jgi:hypothetical protein
MNSTTRKSSPRCHFTERQRAAILAAARDAETVVIPAGRPRDAVSAYSYGTNRVEWWNASQYGKLTNHECNVAIRLVDMQLTRQQRRVRAAIRETFRTLIEAIVWAGINGPARGYEWAPGVLAQYRADTNIDAYVAASNAEWDRRIGRTAS